MSQSLWKQGGRRTSHVLYVPRAIAAVIPEGAKFNAELTDDGVLFRFVGYEDQQPQRDVPEWARGAKP